MAKLVINCSYILLYALLSLLALKNESSPRDHVRKLKDVLERTELVNLFALEHIRDIAIIKIK